MNDRLLGVGIRGGGAVFAYFLKIRFSGDKLGYIKLYAC